MLLIQTNGIQFHFKNKVMLINAAEWSRLYYNITPKECLFHTLTAQNKKYWQITCEKIVLQYQKPHFFQVHSWAMKRMSQ